MKKRNKGNNAAFTFKQPVGRALYVSNCHETEVLTI